MERNVYIELGRNQRIDVDFPYDPEWVGAIKTVEGRRFVSTPHKHWTVPLDMETCRTLREAFGTALVIGPGLTAWARQAKQKEAQLGTVAAASDAELVNLPALCPALAATLHPYQRAGVKFIADAGNPLVADQPGLGKTLEVIGGIFEGGYHEGDHLVVAPLVSLDSVWQHELERWQGFPVFVPIGTKAQRQSIIDDFLATDGPKWLVVNPAMMQYRKSATHEGPVTIKAKPKDDHISCRCADMKQPHWHYNDPFGLGDHQWETLTIDEAHKGAVRNPNTVTAKALNAVQAKQRIAMTGTPMTKNAVDLWGILHFLNPSAFTSKWTWAERYCIIEDNGYGKKIGGLRPEKREALYRSLTPYVLRRTKAEVLTELPPKQFIDLWVELEGKQASQYAEMQAFATATIGDATMPANSVLTEFLRLKQFAIAYNEVRDGKLVPTTESAKLEALLQLLDERGVFDQDVPADQAEKVVVFSQFEEVVTLVVAALRERGVSVERITGKENKRGQRKAIQNAFQQDGGTQVLVMTTTAGGVAITLDRADTVVFMDETWSYADMEQAEDRVHRASRNHQVFIYNIRTRNSIDEYVMETVDEKEALHVNVMDVRRKMLANEGSK